MNCRAIFVLSILVCQSLRGALPDHSTSPSRQFIIYGVTASVRGSVSQVAEQTKSNLLVMLKQPDRWKTAIVVNLQSPQANLPELPPATLRFSQTGFGLKLQLDLTIGRDVDASLIERELLRAIVLELIYRREPEIRPGTIYVEPPDWLLEGVLAATPGRDRQPLIEALAVSEKTMPLEEFMQKRPALLDSPGRVLYRAYSFALVQLLTNGTDGPSQLARYIDNLSHASNDPLADLKTHFPLLRGDVREIWRSSVTKLAATQEYQLLTFAETEHRLDELLRLKIDPPSPRYGAAGNQAGAIDNASPARTNRSSKLQELLERKISPAEAAAVNRLSQELLLLAARANPLLRPIVREYQQIAALVASGKRRKLSERFTNLKATRSKLAARMSKIDDYMNWFEATQLTAKSEVFADYLNAVEAQNEGAPRRRDALSVYLDWLESQL